MKQMRAERSSKRLMLTTLLLCLSLISLTAFPGPAPHQRLTIEALEAAHQEARSYLDQIEVTRYRDAGRNLRGVTLPELTERYKSARSQLDSLLGSMSPPDAVEDRRAFEAIRRAWESEPIQETAADESPLAALTRQVYRSFGEAAQRIEFEGKVLDRLTILGLLPRTGNPQRRKKLFLSMIAHTENWWR